MIALGVLAAVWLFGRRIEARGLASRDVAGQVGLWAVLAGVIGARLYHVITDWQPLRRTTSATSRRSGRAGSGSPAG